MTERDSGRPLLVVRDLCIDYQQKRRAPLRAVDQVNLTLAPGTSLGIVGESGSGKSTLAAAIVGLTPVTSGSIAFQGRDITHLRGDSRRALTRAIQIVFQDPYSSLNPSRTVGQTLAEPLRYNLGMKSAEASARVADLLGRVGLPDTAATLYPNAFSGGQRQRIAIARALALSPQLVIYDEPVSALDLSVQAQVLNLIRELRRDGEASSIFISHDLAVVRHVADDVAVMYQGHIVEHGPANQVYEDPQHDYTKSLLLAAPFAATATRTDRQPARPAPTILPVVPTGER